jgi:hypothetical protein
MVNIIRHGQAPKPLDLSVKIESSGDGTCPWVELPTDTGGINDDDLRTVIDARNAEAEEIWERAEAEPDPTGAAMLRNAAIAIVNGAAHFAADRYRDARERMFQAEREHWMNQIESVASQVLEQSVEWARRQAKVERVIDLPAGLHSLTINVPEMRPKRMRRSIERDSKGRAVAVVDEPLEEGS